MANLPFNPPWRLVLPHRKEHSMVQRYVILLAVALLPSLAAAQPRPDTLAMSCAQVHALVVRAGTFVVGSGPNIYDRYVSGQQFCYPTQYAQDAFVRSADNPQCFIGYRCREIDLRR